MLYSQIYYITQSFVISLLAIKYFYVQVDNTDWLLTDEEWTFLFHNLKALKANALNEQ